MALPPRHGRTWESPSPLAALVHRWTLTLPAPPPERRGAGRGRHPVNVLQGAALQVRAMLGAGALNRGERRELARVVRVLLAGLETAPEVPSEVLRAASALRVLDVATELPLPPGQRS